MKRALLLCLALPLLADIKQKVELGYFGTTGNTNTQSVTAAYRLTYKPDNTTKLHFWSDVLYATRHSKKSAERYRASLELKHHYKRPIFSYLNIGFLRNVFQGYNQQYSVNPGFGYKLYRSKRQHVNLLLGYEFRRNNFTHEPSENLHYIKGEIEHLYKFTKKNRLKTTLDFIENIQKSDDYEIYLESYLLLHIVKRFNFKLTFECKYDNLPPKGKKSTDTITKASIVYSF